jgi:hypothetical protein
MLMSEHARVVTAQKHAFTCGLVGAIALTFVEGR